MTKHEFLDECLHGNMNLLYVNTLFLITGRTLEDYGFHREDGKKTIGNDFFCIQEHDSFWFESFTKEHPCDFIARNEEGIAFYFYETLDF